MSERAIFTAISVTCDDGGACNQNEKITRENQGQQQTMWAAALVAVSAFLVSVILASVCWIALQGFMVLAISYMIDPACFEGNSFCWGLSLPLLFGTGIVCTAYWHGFTLVFPQVQSKTDDEEKDGTYTAKDLCSDTLFDLGEVGFMFGFTGSQFLLRGILNTVLKDFGLQYVHDIRGDYIVVGSLLFWFVVTKIRAHVRACILLKRAAKSTSSGFVSAA